MGSQKAALKFTGVRMLSVLGWRVSLSSLWAILVIAYCVLLVVVLSSALLILRLIRDASVSTLFGSTGPGAVFVVATATCIYLAIGACIREAISSRRYAVRFSPNQDLYRAADVGMHHVFVAEAVPRIVLIFGASAAISTAALITIHDHGSEVSFWTGILWFLPFLVSSSWLALSSRLAAVDPPRPNLIRGILLGALAFVTVGLPGVLLGHVLKNLFESGYVPAILSASGEKEGKWVVFGVGAFTLLLTIYAMKNIVSIKKSPFPVTPKVSSAPVFLREVQNRSPHLLVGKFLFFNIAKDRTFATLTGTCFCLFLLVALALGLRIGGISPEAFVKIHGLPSIASIIVFMVSLIGSELMSKNNNPVGMLPQLRYAWETGIPITNLVCSVVLTQALPLTVLAAPAMSAVVWIVSGTLLLTLVFIPWSIAMATIIGNTYSRVLVKQADGSMETSLAAAFIAVILSIPTLGLLLLEGLYPSIAAGIYTILITGGACLCLQRRVLSHR